MRDLWRKNLEVQSLSYSLIATWSSIHYGSVNKLDFVDRRWQDQCGQAGGRPAARYADRYVRAGGVGQPGTKPASPKQATHTASVPKALCGRASISGGVGHVH